MSLAVGEIDADLAHIAYDTALTSKIMAKRRAEMERRAKLLDPRTRQRGANHPFLDSQVAEKRMVGDREAQEEALHARAAVMQEQVAQAFETMHAQGARDRQTAAVNYSLAELRREQRREYDLSDPNELKNEHVYTHEELNQMGPASCLTLGEDPDEIARKRHEQQMATRDWLNAQKEERLGREIMESEIDRHFEGEMQFANHVRMQCEQAALQEAMEDTYAIAADNQNRAEEHRQRKIAQAEKNNLANTKHATSIMNSDQLKETHDYLIGSNGKLVRTEFRRSSMEELQDMHNTNAYLVLNKRAQAEAERAEDLAAKAVIQQDIAVREALERKKAQATLDRRMQVEAYNRNMIASRVTELTREGVRD